MKTKIILALIFILNISISSQNNSLPIEMAFEKPSMYESPEKFTFAILGDKTTGGVKNWPIFDSAVDEINLLNPDFVIMVGDMIQGTVTDTLLLNQMWKEFRLHSGRLNVPLFVLPGNHDISNEVMYDYWNQKFGKRYYSFVYKNSLFILLNSEEFHKTKEGELGKKQLAFIKKELEINADVNQTFIFLHRPIWEKYSSINGDYIEWKNILEWTKDRKTTVFAGHKHHLSYEIIEGNRYFVHSATGGDLKEKVLPELGYFHHYSHISVEKDTSIVAIIEPGNMHLENIANKDYVNNYSNIVKWTSEIENRDNDIYVNLNICIKNTLSKDISISLDINKKNNLSWKFDTKKINRTLVPNEELEFSFTSKNEILNSFPLPEIDYKLFIDKKQIDEKSIIIAPTNKDQWKYPKMMNIIGGYDLGIKKDPRKYDNISNTHIAPGVGYTSDKTFIDKKLNNGSKWLKAKVENGTVKIDQYFHKNNFALGFLKFIINCEEDSNILASIKPDNYGQVYLNSKLVLSGSPQSAVPESPYLLLLKLKKGDNEILIKTADYYGSWYVDFKLFDPKSKLKYKL